MIPRQSAAPPESLEGARVEWAVAQANRAPSIHNTQPWRFCWDGTSFILLARTESGLPVADPDGRELVISCGAALFNLRLALRTLGWGCDVQLLPDPSNPRVLARLTVTDRSAATADERRLAAAMEIRHTHRGNFDAEPISPELAIWLHQAAAAEGGELQYVHDPGSRHRIEQLTHEAERTQSSDTRVRDELAAWTPPAGSARLDGVPAWAYPATAHVKDTDIAARDFGSATDLGNGDQARRPALLAVLTTTTDLQLDWLKAGISLGAVLTTAAAHGAYAALHSQAIEVASSRAELRRALGTASYPQLVLQFGYAPVAPRTPRRESLDIVLPDAG